MTTPTHRVVIVKDTGGSALWFIQCENPCMRDGYCMGRDSSRGGMCWLGSHSSKELAAAYAVALGYEVAE